MQRRLDTGLPGVAVVELALKDPPMPDGVAPACKSLEHWLVGPTASVPGGRHLLVATCHDGYGAASVSEDQFTVADGLFVHTKTGGSQWRWTAIRKAELVPLRFVHEDTELTYMAGPASTESAFDFRTLAGRVQGKLPACPQPVDVGDGAAEAVAFRFEYAPIPQIANLPGEARGPRAQLGLGDCALRIDGSGEHGYLLKGAPGNSDDARLAVLAVDARTLLIDVEDDLLRGPSERWLYDDHVEVWWAARSVRETCAAGEGRALQWAIRIADGAVFPAYGAPSPLSAEVVRIDDRRARLRVVLPSEGWITVVYSDGDDGRSQERLLATSKLAYGDGATLSEVKPLSPEVVRCAVAAGALRVEPAQRAAAEPVLPQD